MNRERRRAHEARYRERHREEINARRRAQYNPEVARERAVRYRAKNPEQVKVRARKRRAEYQKRHKEELNARARERYALNKDKELARHKAYREANREWFNERARLVYDAKPERKAKKVALERTEKVKAMRRAYRDANPRTEYNRKYEAAYRDRRKQLHYEKQASDPQYRLRRALRASLKNAIKKNQKSGSAIAMLGCSIEELKTHLEYQFAPGMSWENFGLLNGERWTWQIDHIHPLSKFDLTDSGQLRKACHFSNLRPLWALDNRRKANKVLSGKEVPICPLTVGQLSVAMGA